MGKARRFQCHRSQIHLDDSVLGGAQVNRTRKALDGDLVQDVGQRPSRAGVHPHLGYGSADGWVAMEVIPGKLGCGTPNEDRKGERNETERPWADSPQRIYPPPHLATCPLGFVRRWQLKRQTCLAFLSLRERRAHDY